MNMLIFNKINGTNPQGNIPFKNLKKFFNMAKITSFNPVLQKIGQKNSHAIYYQIDTKFYKLLG